MIRSRWPTSCRGRVPDAKLIKKRRSGNSSSVSRFGLYPAHVRFPLRNPHYGILRAWRDVERTAISAAHMLYSRDKGASQIVIVDHGAGRRGNITSDFADPVWIEFSRPTAVP
jgi:hypothetical protein